MHKIGSSDRPDWPLAIVIGAGGMGMAVARRLSQRHRLLVADLDATRADAAAVTLREEGGDALSIACDVTDLKAIQRLVAAVGDLRGFRVLAHVAGLSPSMGDFGAIIRVNLIGAARVAEGLQPLAATGSAAILIASVAGHNFHPPDGVEDLLRNPTDPELVEKLAAKLGPEQTTSACGYGASKFGLIAFCRRAAHAWGKRGARIVSLSPGLIATPMGALEFERNPGKMAVYKRIPLQREGTLLEVADAVEFLASDRASYISGTDLLIDGGLGGALESG